LLIALNTAWGATGDLSQLRRQVATAEEANDYAAILELSRRIVAIAPKENSAWERIARAQVELKDFERCAQTLDAWEKAVKPAPAAIEDFRGDLAMQKEDYEGAERHWLTFLARKPSRSDSAATYDKLADLCAEQSRWIDHEKYRARALALDDSVEHRIAHATALLRLHQWDAAYAEMAKANKTDSSDSQVKEWLPQFERLEKFLPGIRSLGERIANAPNDAGLLLERARLFALADRPLLALDDCERAVQLQPASMRARIQTGEALLDSNRRDDAAKLQISVPLSRGKDNHVSEQVLRELGDLDAQIAQDPKSPEVFLKRAGILRGLHQFVLALADAQAALRADGNSAAAHLEAARNLIEIEQSKEALAQATKATELEAQNSDAWFVRGILEAKRADFAGAIESQTHALKLRERIDALREREQAARRLNMTDAADTDAQRIRELEQK
jgi:tetratricopeptide (TPR) repeat protein